MKELVRQIEETPGFILVAVDQDDPHLFQMTSSARDGMTIGSVDRIDEQNRNVQLALDLVDQTFGWNDAEIKLGDQAFRALLCVFERRLRGQPQGTLEHTRPAVLLLAQPAKQADPLTSLELEPVQAVFWHLRRGTPGKLRLPSNGERVDEKINIAIK